ncbi:MAG TPA: ABC transporter substrate-binding protein, partial [Polyangia bacterium]
LNTQGVPVRHVACDTGGDVNVAQRAFDLAVTQYGAVAVVGPNTSSELIALAPDIKARGVAVVSPAASSPPIADLVDDGLIWRTCGSDTLQAEVLSTLVPAASTLDIVWVTMDPYADNLEKAFVEASGRSDGLGIQFTSGDVGDAVAQMNDPEVAVLIVDFDAPALVAALAGAGQTMTQYLMTDSALTPTLWGAGPYDFTFLSRIRGTAPALPQFTDPSGPVFAAFEVSYEAAFSQESPADTAFVANAYDAAYAIAIAAAAAGTAPTGRVIAANLGHMSDPLGMSVNVGPGDYQAGVNTLDGGGTINLVGTSGPIDWDAQGDVLTAPTEVWQVADDGTGMPTFKVLSTVTP